MIKAVLFDMDGILYDSEKFYMDGTIRQMRAYGYTGPEKAIYRIIGTTMDGTYDILYDLLKGTVPRSVLVANNEHYFGTEHPLPYRQIMFAGVPEALHRLRSLGLRTACCSSSPRATIDTSLTAMGIAGQFDYIESSEACAYPKPAPDIYLRAAAVLGLAPAECLVYEDSETGIEAGRQAGMKVIARRDDRYGQNQSRADIMVTDIQGLVGYVEGELSNERSHKD